MELGSLSEGDAWMIKAKRRSVMMVNSQMPPVYGGAGGQAALLGRALAELGWEVSAVTLDQAGVGSGTEQGIRVYRLLRGVAPKSVWTRLLTTFALGAGAFVRVMARRPLVVHIHGAYWWSILPAVAGRLIGAKVVVKLTRDGEDDAHTVYSKQLGPLAVGRIYGLSLTMADAIIVLNEKARRIALSEGLGARVHSIPNGVDDVQLIRSPLRRLESRAKKSLSVQDRVVIFVGYLVRHKGVIDLLEAWRILDRPDVNLWLVGPFEGFHRELDNEIPRLLDDLARDGYRVTIFGQLPNAELPMLYWAADVFTLPSYVEGMPNSLAEALVAGCRVVATRIPGITELMGADSPDLVTPGDARNLAERLAVAIAAPRAAQGPAVERLRISTIARAYDRLYKELLALPEEL